MKIFQYFFLTLCSFSPISQTHITQTLSQHKTAQIRQTLKPSVIVNVQLMSQWLWVNLQFSAVECPKHPRISHSPSTVVMVTTASPALTAMLKMFPRWGGDHHSLYSVVYLIMLRCPWARHCTPMLWMAAHRSSVWHLSLWVCDPVHVHVCVNRCQPGWVKSGGQILCVCMYAWPIKWS